MKQRPKRGRLMKNKYQCTKIIYFPLKYSNRKSPRPPLDCTQENSRCRIGNIIIEVPVYLSNISIINRILLRIMIFSTYAGEQRFAV
jgi:hypothetical protein